MCYGWDGDCCHAVRLGAGGGEDLHDDAVSRWLAGYFAGGEAPPPPLAAPATPFQARLRRALEHVGRGETVTYGALARMVGSAPRATGRALGANPLPLLVPCHRVVAARGRPGGFSAGLEWKLRLLSLERKG
ncbi:MAG: methylated-DNA--[protein]-cysteine S-methyltransferase [Zetaproteobacteria bacterium]|nr:MAG: methylated-DNA--[protein]-cysteine S-methyltransferase [Zetaproteobacteria bacterium]